jgi:hypothetical protein
MRLIEDEGVMRPELPAAANPNNVVYPVDEAGVIRPESEVPARSPREEATEEGLETAPGPTVGGESFVLDTKTPHLGGH